MKKNNLTIEYIKKLGKESSEKNFDVLLDLYKNDDVSVELKREIVSSIGRQDNKDRVYNFLKENALEKNYMDIIYQMFRTVLYNIKDIRFKKIGEKMIKYYDNEMLYKMARFKLSKVDYDEKIHISSIGKPIILEGDSSKTLKKIKSGDINLIFTSPPYYNARVYSDYTSYEVYLRSLTKTFKECFRVLQDGRFLIVNVSPVITKRPGREFESIRYPIHFDLHQRLVKCGFEFVDEIIWVKPEACVPNRVGGYLQTKNPLSYKPNCITESIMVYRKKCDFLLDYNIKKYLQYGTGNINYENTDTSNCWYINPTYNKEHPAVFPEELCYKILKYYSFKEDVVLDPFAGSGTFGKVAIQTGRVPVMCEQNEEYIKLIRRNLNL